MVLDPIPQCLPVHIFGSRPQPPTSLQNTTSWNDFVTINLNLNWISIALGGAVLNKDPQYKYKGTWYKFKFAEKRSLEPSFYPHGIPSKEPYILSKEPYIFCIKNTLYSTTKEPYILGIPSKEPYILSKEPYILSKEPYILSKEPYIPSKEPYILSKEPYILSKEPYILSEEPYILSKEPYILWKEPYILCIQRALYFLHQKYPIFYNKRALHSPYPKSPISSIKKNNLQWRWFAPKESYQRSYSISKEPYNLYQKSPIIHIKWALHSLYPKGPIFSIQAAQYSLSKKKPLVRLICA